MNCFWIYIFDKIPTGMSNSLHFRSRLWIAFEFISLTRFQQAGCCTAKIWKSCELLLNLYLWQDSNRYQRQDRLLLPVVNCFWIYIFDKIPTGSSSSNSDLVELWIAFEFISLTRFQQATTTTTDKPAVVNCFWIYIFDKIPTGRCVRQWYWRGCELLLNLYLWQDSNRAAEIVRNGGHVVNCFWIYIFDKIPTGVRHAAQLVCRLWIAFEFISLTRFQQVKSWLTRLWMRCELLLNLYLWQDSNRISESHLVYF